MADAGIISIETALSLLRAGLAVLPAVLEKKCPAVKHWKTYQERQPTESEIKAWFSNRHDALCIVTGKSSGNLEMIDFDNGGELFGAWMNIVEKTMPGLSERLVIERSKSGGRHAVYRCESEISKNMKLAQRRDWVPEGEITAGADGREVFNLKGKGHSVRRDKNGRAHIILTLIETRGTGGIFLCAPTCGYELIQGTFTAIPLLKEAEREALLQAAWELNQDWKDVKEADVSGSADNSFSVRPGDDFNERGDVRILLRAHGWQHVHTACESEYYRRPGKDSGSWSASLKGNVFYVFSSNAQPFEPNKAYAPFSVYALLEHDGNFTKAADALLEQGYGVVQKINDVDITGITGQIGNNAGEEILPELKYDPEPIPEEIFNVPGFVSELMAYTLRTAPYPNKTLAFAGALALQAHLAGRKIETIGGIRSNPYIIALAKSGSGKDHPRKVNNRILTKLGLGREVKEKIASSAGLEDALVVTPSLIWQADEFYSFLLEVAQDKSGAKELIVAMILMLFSSANTTVQTRLKAGGATADLHCPNLTIFGCSTPGSFFESLNNRMLEHGLFSRLTILEAESRGKGQLPGDLNDIPHSILETARRWTEFRPHGSGNLNFSAKVVPVTKDAEKLLIDVMKRADEKYAAVEKENGLEWQLAIWSRVFEHILKYSLLYAASESSHPENTVISYQAVSWAEKFIFWEAKRKIAMTEHNYHESEFARCSQRVIDILEHWHAAHGKDVLMPGWKFNRRIKGMPPNYLKAVIESLKNQERIVIQGRGTKGRLAVDYGLPF